MTRSKGVGENSRFSDFFSLSGATGPLIGLLMLCAFLSFATDSFLSFRNFLNVADQITVLQSRDRFPADESGPSSIVSYLITI